KNAAEDRLRLSEERFRVALRDSGIFVWQQDSELRYTWQYNTVGAVLESDVVGRTDEALFPAEEAARLMALERRVIETGAGLKGEISLTVRGQRRDFMYNLEPLRDASGQIVGLTGASVDVTEQKAFERRLLDTQKLDSIGLLAGGIAHDFNNLLVSVIGNANLAADLLPAGSQAIELLHNVMSAGIRAAQLTSQILAYSGQGRFVLEPVDLSDLLREMTGILQASVRERTRLAFDLAPDLGCIEADVTQMQQLVMNLVLNAAEAIGTGGGVIMLRTRALTMTEAALSKSMGGANLPAGNYVSLEIRDTGAGMDEQTKARIFDPFFTTKAVGRGLGLPAALGIVRGHRGAIDVTSKPGKGATVRVLLPLAAR
ncbi:MAG TPA: ATP-binding protein, partial [Bryobacteraceae bacterium]|nr:ATP-binding protein [Bryobacteraceae bacterium]